MLKALGHANGLGGQDVYSTRSFSWYASLRKFLHFMTEVETLVCESLIYSNIRMQPTIL